MDIPSYIRPWMFDFTSQNRQITIRTMIQAITPFSSDAPNAAGMGGGTGSILDQIEDILYIMSGNWWSVSTPYLTLYVPYPTSMNASHDLLQLYPASGNTDYAMDQASVPTGTTEPVGSGVTRTKTDKKYYIYPVEADLPRDEASVNRVNISLTFMEVQDSVKI